MTSALTRKVDDGIVIASDSATTTTLRSARNEAVVRRRPLGVLLAAALLASCTRGGGGGADARSAPEGAVVQWIAAHKDRAPGNGTRCGPDGFCTERVELPSGTVIMSTALKEDPRSFAYGLFTRADVTCGGLGAHRVVREWDVTEKDDQRIHYVECDLTDPSLAGLRARIATSKGADPQLDKIGHLTVFVPKPVVVRHLEIDATD